MWTRLTRTSLTSLGKQPKRLSHAVIKTTIFCAGILLKYSFLIYCRCWDAECESLYRMFQFPQEDNSNLAATALLAKLDRKRRNRWSEAVRSIDFSHSSRKTWGILNNLTGKSRYSPRHCPVSADVIASQLVRNGKYEAVDRK